MIILLLIIPFTISLDLQLQAETQLRPEEQKIIRGITTFNNMQLKTECQCISTTPEINLAEELCEPTKIKIHQDSPGVGQGGASFEEIRFMIGSLSDIIFVDPVKYHFSCLDGRIKDPILGTPGGDAGEFILALHVYETLTPSRKLNQDAVDSIFTSFLTLMQQAKFYMCTDDDAIDHIERELGISFSIEALKRPQEAMKHELLQALLKPENIGCMHIRNMIKNPDNYGIRSEIILMFIKSFYKILWDRSNPLSEKLKIDNLIGRREEKGFVEIRSNEACERKKMAPLITPKKKIKLSSLEVKENQEKHFYDPETEEQWMSIFVNHIDAISTKRRVIWELARFFSENLQHIGEHIDIDQMHHRLNKHGLTYLELTGARVAKYLPFYTLSLL